MLTYAGFIIAAALSALVVFLARKRVVRLDGGPGRRVLGANSPVLAWAQQQATLHRTTIIAALELLAIGAWALWVGRKFLNFDPQIWHVGREFGLQVYGFHFGELLLRCGTCSLWNGLFNGGGPFLADPFTGALHPVSALAGMLAGAVNGAKLTALASMWMAGIGQWWIGRSIGLGRWSRVWGALAAASGGHVVGRMELGSVNLVLSTAASSLALAGAFDLAIHQSRKASLRLAILLALAILSGVAYLQVALLFWTPWIALIAWDRRKGKGLAWREFALAGTLAVLLAGIFLVPFAHAWPSLKKASDPLFRTSQPFEYIPLNLVIHDWDHYLAGVLGSTPFPFLHTLFVGWPAMILAAIGIGQGRKEDRILLAALALGAITMFWLASATPFRWAAQVLPSIAGVRHVALTAGLAVPAVLAMAGYGLDRLWEKVVSFTHSDTGGRGLSVRVSFRAAWLFALPLAAALAAADRLDQHFLATYSNSRVYEAIPILKTADLQWVAPPGGEHFWVEAALSQGFKLTDVVTPFWWRNRRPARPFLAATRDEEPANVQVVAELDEVPVYLYPQNLYAFVVIGSQRVPCTGRGLGGEITVTCERGGGRLIIHENAWPGWSATVNGKAAPLSRSRWLVLNIPSGPARIRLRYLPADALLGVLASLAGAAAVVVLWRREGRSAADVHRRQADEAQI